MSETYDFLETSDDHHRPGLYEIRIKGHLDGQWAGWFDGMTITREDNGVTLLAGRVVDQAALHGLLKKVRALAMPLISVNPVAPGTSAAPDGER